jgi:hypothetical protein
MAKFESSFVLTDLKKRTEFCIKEAKKLLKRKEDLLNLKSSPESWSALECIDHLNNYGRFYLPEIEGAISKINAPSVFYFKSGFIGNVFAKAMLPKEKLTVMSSPSNMDPSRGTLTKDVLNTFLVQQKNYLDILDQSKNKNLNKSRIKVTISKWVRINLGDALRINVYHNERHILQALKASKN